MDTSRPVATLVNRNTIYDQPIKHDREEHKIRLVSFRHMDANPGQRAKTILRIVKGDGVIHVGRVEREAGDIVFPEKVVSRYHAELRVRNGQWFVKDVGSSSGTFLNNNRMSTEERLISPGDVIKFGTDYRNGTEPLYRAVIVRVELEGTTKQPISDFQNDQLNVLQNLKNDANNETCAICLDGYKSGLAVFMSPCGHMWHYRCICPVIQKGFPLFECVMCRKLFDLNADSDDEEADEDVAVIESREFD